ncbi:glycoside hydrolase family 5 protein [Luteolibacter sp. GHJ8]|uniref:Glycoside hydrolase family 5 protein n=1 Tax=Luteolibacter rhizosphaerae TaxID=2989719 RepID=A0ABT3G9B6_9BACT|nr:glycoside hydrolase family 5 protein [Luteolibacter rhizosphaerae]MCW1916194.1 glycoside hydrolase family 5 protein [Luteolibacter rhizosphaerae]
MLRRLLPLLLALPAAAEDFVPYPPAEARLFLRVPAAGQPIRDLRVSLGEASPGTFEDSPEKNARLSDIRFPIRWWNWREMTVSFTPAHDGEIELDLNGPWAEARPGVLRQQEVLWDELSATGTTIPNGGFEAIADGKPASWESPWRPYPAAGQWPLAGSEPLAGKSCAASWHGRPLISKLTVKSGVPVSLKLHARAATVPGFKAPARLGQDTPAHRACATLKRGVNFGNGWEAPPGSWGIKYGIEDVDRVADEGFDHIRVPVAWHYHLENGAIKPALLAELEPVLKRALERKLTVILNWHHFEDLCKEPEKHRAAFASGWEIVARHFKDWPQQLFFELLNEPNAALDDQILAKVHADGIAAIRKSNPERILLANPPQWASVPGLDRFFLPDGDERIIASIHSYEPFQFTHQRASWVNLQDLRGISYPGPPPQPVTLPESLRGNAGLVAWIEAYNTRKGSDNPCTAASFELLLDDAAAWSTHFGRPIHIGEFGCFKEADPASRERYIRDFRKAAEKRRMPWAMWDWKAGFGYWDAENQKTGLREALFAK